MLVLPLALSAASCGGDSDSGGPCTSDTDCPTGTVCNTGSGLGAVGSCGCTATSCPATQYCDDISHACMAKCTDDTSCAGGEHCNAATGMCEAMEPDCTVAGNDCAADQVCNTTTKVCDAKCTATSCAGDTVCYEDTGLCGPGCNSTAEGHPTCTAEEACSTTTGLCIRRCDAATNPLQCANGEVCDPASGMCTTRCAAEGDAACAAPQVCDVDGTGLCGECVTLDQCEYGKLCSAQACMPAEDATCGTDSIARPAGEAWTMADGNGPIAWTVEVTAAAGQLSNGDACPTLVQVTVGYHDPQGDFPMASGGPLNRALWWLPKTGTASTSASDALTFIEGDGTSGKFKFPVCYQNTTSGSFKYYLKDTAGHYGNSACFTFGTQN